MLRTLLEQESSAVAIDLKDVLLVDREAIKLLALRQSNGTELRNCPAYIREWVTRERADMKASKQGPIEETKSRMLDTNREELGTSFDGAARR